MKNRTWMFLGIMGLVTSIPVVNAAEVQSIEFGSVGTNSEIKIVGDGPLTFDKQENEGDKQIVINIPGAKLSDSAKKKLDTSSFDSRVIMVSPYETEGEDGGLRVVIQLKDFAAAEVAQDGDNLVVKVPNPPESAKADLPPPPGDVPPMDFAASAPAVTPPAPPKPAAPIEEFMVSSQAKQFTGKPITLQVRDTELADVFRLIAEASGFNILLGDDVKGKITLSMIDVPWDQVLDTLLHTQKLGAERNGNVLRIVTLANLTAEKQAELNARTAAESAAPRITQVFPINFANLDELSATLSKFVGTTSTGAQAQGASSGSTFVQADRRTNALVIRDIPDNLTRMRKLIEVLDVQTPQVLIEAKVVEVSEGFSNSISGSLGIGGSTSRAIGFGSFIGGNPFSPLLGSPGVFADGSAIASDTISSSTSNSKLGFGLQDIDILGKKISLNSILNLGESENKLKIAASPRIVVLNKETANVLQSKPVLVPTVTQSSTGTGVAETVQEANLSLNVTPTVTNEGSVLLNLTVSRDVPELAGGGKSGIGRRNMTTKVLVDSGSTIVMGGVYTNRQTNASDGFPILRKIPIIGWFFGSEQSTTEKSELFFFITPRILNPKEAGLIEGT